MPMRRQEREEAYQRLKVQIEAVTSSKGLDDEIKAVMDAAGGADKSIELLASLLGVDTATDLLVMAVLRKESRVFGRPTCHRCHEAITQENIYANPYAISPLTHRPIRSSVAWRNELRRFRKKVKPLTRAEKALLFAICPWLDEPSPSLCLLVFCGKKCSDDFRKGVPPTDISGLFKL